MAFQNSYLGKTSGALIEISADRSKSCSLSHSEFLRGRSMRGAFLSVNVTESGTTLHGRWPAERKALVAFRSALNWHLVPGGCDGSFQFIAST